LGWMHFRQPPEDQRVLRFQIEPPEGAEFSFGANASGIALSPDGKTAAYVAQSNGKSRLNLTSGQQIQRRRRLPEKLLVVVGFGPLPNGALVLIEARNACTSVTSPMGRGSDGSSRYCT